MDHPHDIYWLFNRYWWLLFPLFWMVIGIIRLSLSHSHANRTLDIIKAYADQGKEPPPELMKNLQGGMDGGCGPFGGRYSPESRLHRAVVFTALAIAFGVLTFWNYDDGGHWHHHGGLFIPMMIFAALAFSNFLSLLLMPRGPDDKDRR